MWRAGQGTSRSVGVEGAHWAAPLQARLPATAGEASTRRLLKRLGSRALRAPAVRRVAAATAAIRGRRLVLVFHRIIEDEEPAGGVVPAVPQGVFRRQLEQILEVGDIVPLTSMITETSVHARPRFALTFDDDYISHYEVALPILREWKVTATFFLGGRSLHGLGPLWFEILDELVLSRGVAELGRWLGIGTGDLLHLTQACENDRRLQRRIEAEDAAVARHLTPDQITALANAGMTIGFHTLHHRLLTGLPDHEIDSAMTEGRAELEDAIGDRLDLFAYPHGKADESVRKHVQRAGYVAAWTGRPRAFTRRDDRYLLGRWEAGPLHGHDLVARVIATLNRWAGV
jgi:peptidoglycan/xylan/chitin deacetylase (PgdA/CDA1 family)